MKIVGRRQNVYEFRDVIKGALEDLRREEIDERQKDYVESRIQWKFTESSSLNAFHWHDSWV